MGYFLGFWKYRRTAIRNDPEVYSLLSDGEFIDRVQILETDRIREGITDNFTRSGWNQIHENRWEKPDRKGFDIFTTPQFVRIECDDTLPDPDILAVIRTLNRFGCPHYDPQRGRRYHL